MANQRPSSIVFAIAIGLISGIVATRPTVAWGQGAYEYRYARYPTANAYYPRDYADYPHSAWFYWGQLYAPYDPSYWSRSVPEYEYVPAYETPTRSLYYGPAIAKRRPYSHVADTAVAAAANSRSYYYAPAAANSRAHLTVEVPAPSAQLWLEGQPMRQEGTLRNFDSPPLEPGVYTYTVRARWRQNGQERDETHTARIRPGQNVEIRFGP